MKEGTMRRSPGLMFAKLLPFLALSAADRREAWADAKSRKAQSVRRHKNPGSGRFGKSGRKLSRRLGRRIDRDKSRLASVKALQEIGKKRGLSPAWLAPCVWRKPGQSRKTSSQLRHSKINPITRMKHV